jgi:hypothetical protein
MEWGMDTIDRMAVVVLPREPVVDWVNEADPDHLILLEDISWRGNVYLIPSFESLEEAEDHIEAVFDEIFCNELAGWVADEDKWPAKRTYDMFIEWFDVIYDVVVFDTLKGSIKKY